MQGREGYDDIRKHDQGAASQRPERVEYVPDKNLIFWFLPESLCRVGMHDFFYFNMNFFFVVICFTKRMVTEVGKF